MKKMTAGTVTRPPPSPPPSICSSSLEMVATEMSLTAESVLAVLLFCQRADWRVRPLIWVWVSAWAVGSLGLLLWEEADRGVVSPTEEIWNRKGVKLDIPTNEGLMLNMCHLLSQYGNKK